MWCLRVRASALARAIPTYLEYKKNYSFVEVLDDHIHQTELLMLLMKERFQAGCALLLKGDMWYDTRVRSTS